MCGSLLSCARSSCWFVLWLDDGGGVSCVAGGVSGVNFGDLMGGGRFFSMGLYDEDEDELGAFGSIMLYSGGGVVSSISCSSCTG